MLLLNYLHIDMNYSVTVLLYTISIYNSLYICVRVRVCVCECSINTVTCVRQLLKHEEMNTS